MDYTRDLYYIVLESLSHNITALEDLIDWFGWLDLTSVDLMKENELIWSQVGQTRWNWCEKHQTSLDRRILAIDWNKLPYTSLMMTSDGIFDICTIICCPRSHKISYWCYNIKYSCMFHWIFKIVLLYFIFATFISYLKCYNLMWALLFHARSNFHCFANHYFIYWFATCNILQLLCIWFKLDIDWLTDWFQERQLYGYSHQAYLILLMSFYSA